MRPVGDVIIGGMGLRDFDAPRSLTEAMEQTVALGLKIVSARCPDIEISDNPAPIPEPAALSDAPLTTEELAIAATANTLPMNVTAPPSRLILTTRPLSRGIY